MKWILGLTDQDEAERAETKITLRKDQERLKTKVQSKTRKAKTKKLVNYLPILLVFPILSIPLTLPALPSSPIPHSLQSSKHPRIQDGEAECAERLK